MIPQHNLPAYLKGLTDAEVIALRKIHGLNTQYQGARNTWWKITLNVLKEPMLIILLLIAGIYFVFGNLSEGYFMLGAIVVVAGISFYQDNRSRIAIEALQKLNTPLSRVIRNGDIVQIITTEIVPGDLVIAEEGGFINADGTVVYSHDFSVDESSLTGEAFSVYKSESSNDAVVYSGTMVSSGMAVYKVELIGSKSKLGEVGKSLSDMEDETSPLQVQIQSFVRKMMLVGFIVFLLVCVVSFLRSNDFFDSLLKGLTMAMSILPEEIPVAFAAFMALGSRRLIKEGILVKRTRVVETLGSATLICSDKTGTITENKMNLQSIYTHAVRRITEDFDHLDDSALKVLEAAMWASEPEPFDPMEKTIHHAYAKYISKDRRPEFDMVHEYPLGGVPPMMTHVYQDESKNQIVAAKGAPEAIMDVCQLSVEEKNELNHIVEQLAIRGLRILGIAIADGNVNPYPIRQQDITFRFLGFVAFQDPPKENIRSVFNKFYDAGLIIKVITGDNAITTKAIVQQAGLRGSNTTMDGNDLVKLNESDLDSSVRKINIFTRMFPEAKLMAINSLRKQKHIVAMIGDGVNDGPALKAADIGIAMGIKGTEIAKSAADLILINDDLEKLVHAIGAGRRIYANLKKAIQYIISIHIPIIATVTLPLFLGWIYPTIFTPVHVIFLELIMGPTCSIVYENEPMERNAMQQPPRPASYNFLNWNEMGRSIMQGLMITAGILFVYQYAVRTGGNEDQTRTFVFITLIFSNIFLTLVNRSSRYSVVDSLRNKNTLLMGILSITLIMLASMIFIPFVRSFFALAIPSGHTILICLATAFVSVGWFEIWKWVNRLHERGDERPAPLNEN